MQLMKKVRGKSGFTFKPKIFPYQSLEKGYAEITSKDLVLCSVVNSGVPDRTSISLATCVTSRMVQFGRNITF